mgnify:CR=1 FL=1
MSTSPFDFINAICNKKPEIMEEPQADIQYRKSAFIVNRGLAYFPDTIMQANNMNLNSHIPPDWQFSYYASVTSAHACWAGKDKPFPAQHPPVREPRDPALPYEHE